MKKYLMIASAALVALAACTKEKDYNEPAPVNEGAVLTFTSQRPQLTPDTKTAWNSTTSSIDWTSGDKIRVGYTLEGKWMAKEGEADFVSETKVPAKFFASSNVVIDSKDAALGTFSVPSDFTNKPTGKAIFYAVYPNSAINADAYSAPILSVTLPANQTPGANTFDSAADVMVGQSSEIDLTGTFPVDPIELDWTRIVAHADLTFSNVAVGEGETVSKITLTFNEGAKVAGSFYVDVTTGAVTTNSNSKNEIVLSGTNLSIDGNSIKAWVSLMPVTFTSLNVEIETNKAVYSRAITEISKAFVKNARNTLTINMSTASKTEKTGQLVADGYYVISYEENMMTVGTENNTYRGTATKNTTDPADEAIWRIKYVAASDAYTILSLGAQKELRGVTTDNTTLSLGGNNGTNLFTIEKSSSEATTYKIAPAGNTSRSIGYNSSATRFALYQNTGSQPITLDLTAVTVNETPEITIADEEKTKEVAASATSVTFAYTANIFATEAPTVAVASDPDGIVNGTPTAADGTITVKLNANTENKAKTATLTVSGAGIATPITLTINQEAKLGDVYAYSFTSKSWNATRDNVAENWTSGKDGNQYNNNGIQVTTGATGANGTSPFSFTDISKVVLTYCTNGSSGAGTIDVQIGENTKKTVTVTKTGGTSARTLTINYETKESGKVKITVNCTDNSIYLIGASITAASINLPTEYAITCATGLDNGSVEADKETAYEGATVNLTAKPDDGYKLGDWNVYKTDDETTKVTVSGNSFEMPAYPVTVSASFVKNTGGTSSSLIFTAACGGSGTADDNVEWTVTSDGAESIFDENRGIHYGTNNKAVQYIRLTTSDIPGTITKVVVNAAAASTATVSVTVGGSAFGGNAQTLTSSAADYTFEDSAEGEIIVTVTKPSSATKALYVKSIIVTYEN